MNAQLKPSHGRYYIGGGNVAGILAVSPYKTPLDEYRTIMGEADEPDQGRLAFFKRRKALEPFCAEVFQLETGMQIARRNIRYTHPAHEFIRAEVDFEVDSPRGIENGETKTVHSLAARDWGHSGSDDVPMYVVAQAMHGLGVTGRKAAWVHALVGLDDDRIYRVERDEATIKTIRTREVDFWHGHVEPQLPPPATSLADVLFLFPTDSGRSVDADEAALADYERLKEITPLAKEIDEIRDRLRLYMRDATTLTREEQVLATWKAQQARRFDQAAFAAEYPELFEQFKTASTTRVLRIK